MTSPTLLVTRPRPQCAAWLARLAALGQPAAALPLIEIRPAQDPMPVQAAWAALPAVDLAVFVSPNAVAQFFAQAGGAAWPAATLAACVGPGSAQALAEHGVPAGQIVQPAADAASLDSEHLWLQLQPRRDWAGARVLLLRGDGGREWLAERLAESGAQVEAVTVYHREGPRFEAAEQALLDAVRTRPADHVWLFSSAEAVGHVVPLLAGLAPAGRRAITTHPRIAEAARAAGFAPVVLARPDPQAVTQALKVLLTESAAVSEPISAVPVAEPAAPPPPTPVLPAWLPWLLALLGAAVLLCVALAWQSLTRQQSLEQELVRRQEASQTQATEARLAAKQSAELVRDTAAKLSLLEARLAEVALQRGQLEELIQSMSRSRDENVVGDIEAAIRVALQQTQITGSAEPLVATLKQADERLLRYKQPRLEGVRRAVARDLDRVKAVAVVDVSTLTIKLDEVVRMSDELPLVSGNEATPKPRDERGGDAAKEREHAMRLQREQAAAAADGKLSLWWWQAGQQASSWAGIVWGEAKTLLRVTRIEHPEAALMSPDQSFFLRENLKLRLLNARLALLSRQFDTAQSDLQDCQEMLKRYFDGRSRKVTAVTELLRQVGGQARQVTVPRPDDTLAALTAAAAGR